MTTAVVIDYIPRSGKRKRKVTLETITRTQEIVLVDFAEQAFREMYEREHGKLIGRTVEIGDDRKTVRFV
jgi:hypothetical protein